MGHHQKRHILSDRPSSGLLLSISQSNFPTGEDPQKLEIQAPVVKIGKQVIKDSAVKTDQYGDHFVEKGQAFHVFFDVFCEFRQGETLKNNRRVNRDKISQLIGLTDRRNIVEIHDFWRDFSG